VQIIRKNFGLKVLAVALAVVGWAYVRFASNPIVATARFDQQFSVPIGAIDLPVGYVAHFTDREAVVTVESKRGEPPVKPDEIKAVLDLSNKGSGVYNVPVQLVAPNIVVQSLSPASVTLTIEKIETRLLPVAFHYVGSPIAGLVVSDARINPEAVTIQGPSSLLSQVAAVHVDVALPGQARNVDEMLRPVAVSPFGMEVSGLDVTPDLVRVRVRFVADANVREQK
jgi:YbbR domain-containing protein